MKKEIYKCDRCGAEFDSFPKSIKSVISKVGTKAEIDMLVELLSDKEKILKEML